ncbi:MAG: DUF4139 domain-containing protein [Gammaproteobacteria bacterium]|nr:DUF4139 domain-containing protein [Gammaproteobacteria bacterium]
MKRLRFKSAFILSLLTGLLIGQVGATAHVGEVKSTIQDQAEVAVTIYNDQLALVKDLRTIRLDNGFNKLAFREVSAQMRPETALLRSLDYSDGFYLIEQNFDFDLLTPQTLLEKYVGKKVLVVKTHPITGKESLLDAVVLSVNNGVVLRIGDRIETGVPGRIVFDEVPGNLRDRPTLVMQLNSATTKPQQLQLSYLTGGLTWKADYVAELDKSDKFVDLTSWVTLTNQSGATYKNAKLQLVAGDVNRVQNEYKEVKRKFEMLAEESMVADADMVEEALFEYHLYTLQRPTTIAENQTKQVSLLSATKIPVKKEFLLQGQNYYYTSSYGFIGQKLKVGVFVEFNNDKESNLGMPLPKGVVRVYKNDKSGNAQFVGEDHIDHTPKKEDVRLKLGDAFDVTADKKQTEFKKAHAIGKYRYAYTASFQIDLKNAKNEEVEVMVREPIPGDWKMKEQSHKHEKVASGTAEWKIKVPAEGKTTLTYKVLIRY